MDYLNGRHRFSNQSVENTLGASFERQIIPTETTNHSVLSVNMANTGFPDQYLGRKHTYCSLCQRLAGYCIS